MTKPDPAKHFSWPTNPVPDVNLLTVSEEATTCAFDGSELYIFPETIAAIAQELLELRAKVRMTTPGHAPPAEHGHGKLDTAHLRQLYANATQGSWRARTHENHHRHVVSGGNPPDAGVAECGLDLGDDWVATVNGSLIAESHNALPALLDAYDVIEDAFTLISEGGDEDFTEEVKARLLKVLHPEMLVS